VFSPSPSAFKGETPVVAVDCEMVEVDRFNDGLARVSIVNYNGVVLLDKFVIPEGKMVTNYRTWVSGVTPDKLKTENGAIFFKEAKKIAHRILKDKIIVGHSIGHDFSALELPESLRPSEKIRDLSHFKKYQNQMTGQNG
jgi:RNA exonuclease 4